MTDGPHAGRTTVLAMIAALATAAGFAAAAHPDREDRPGLDANGDGSIDLAEIQAVRPGFSAEKFAAADANGDGLLSHEEMRALHPRGRDRPKLDTNEDGQVSLEEMQAARPGVTEKRFRKLDADADGQLSRDELKAARELFRQARGERGRQTPEPD